MTDSARHASHSNTARKIVLWGWAAKGVVYVTLAYLVLQMAFGAAPQQATTTGALQYLASTGPGTIALIVLGIGLVAFAIGRILEVTTLAGPGIDAQEKAKAAVLSLVYGSLALSAFAIAGVTGSSGRGSGGGGGQQGSAFLLGLPGGQVLVAIVGLLVIAFGVHEASKGVTQKFKGTLRTGEMSSSARSATLRIGTAAYVTKGAILALLGYFFVQSALAYNPKNARGLDAALHQVARQSWGQVVLALVAAGLFAYGVFAFIESRYRRVGSSATGTTS